VAKRGLGRGGIALWLVVAVLMHIFAFATVGRLGAAQAASPDLAKHAHELTEGFSRGMKQ
jgi:hypothetical protein